uniref:Retrotransposon gag domain-containing protein n=1 Tax=Trichuris muris TaxID=70415 RepID=A0A5S6QUD0_TRIMR
MPRSCSVLSAGYHASPVTPVAVPSDNGNLPNAELARICDLLTNLTEKLDRVVLNVAPNHHRGEQSPSVDAGSCEANGISAKLEPPQERAVPSSSPSIQVDQSWFEPKLPSPHVGTQVPNPWLQKLVPAANIEIFDGDPKCWPRFIAGFKSIVHDSLSSDVDRLAILAQLLSPRLREGFAVLSSTPTMYHQVLQELQRMYGDPVAAVQSHAAALTSVEPLRSESLAELERFYLQVNGPVSILEVNGLHNELNSVILVSQVSCKLTLNLREKWAHQVHSRSHETLNLRDFVD